MLPMCAVKHVVFFNKGSDNTVQFAPKFNQDFVDLWTLEDGAEVLSQNVGTELPLYAA